MLKIYIYGLSSNEYEAATLSFVPYFELLCQVWNRKDNSNMPSTMRAIRYGRLTNRTADIKEKPQICRRNGQRHTHGNTPAIE